jgi:hypothetical protein
VLAPRRGFRYLPLVRLVAMAGVSLAVAVSVTGGLGCRRGAPTPAEALARVNAAVAARDPYQLYRALDVETRWSWMSVRRAHREAYDIVLSNVPEGPAREQQLRRYEPAALSASDATLFAQRFATSRWDELKRELESKPTPVRLLRQGADGSWGFAGLAAEAEEEKRRATADLELMRTNAADLERAAIRAGR